MDLSGLNPPQREAVEHGTGPLLVLAGAGSGKTRVITHRMALLLERGVSARDILAVTFTNKAAGEMRERVAGLVRDKKTVDEITIGTFHALGLQILRQERKALGFPRGFAIYDASDQLGCVREILRTIHNDDRRYDVKAILSRISLAKNAFVSPEDYAVREGDDYDEITAEVYPRYEESLRAFAAVDFDDLIVAVVRLFDSDDEVRQRWAGRFGYVMVDEYQDTNRAQLLLVKHLVARHHNLCVVGDDDQSIYAWRGADPTNILQFERMFEGAHVVKLEQNYRSTPNILRAANSVIANNTNRHDKALWSDKETGPPIVSAVAEMPDQEAEFVCQEINRLHNEHGTRHGAMAVLYRSNIQTRLLEEHLREHEVPYVMYGGQQFFERKEVKDVIAYLRVALSARDEISLRRVVNYPSRGIGPTTLERLARYSHQRNVTLWTALTRADGIDDLKPSAIAAASEFTAAVSGLKASLATDGVERATRELIERIGLYDDLRAASPSGTVAQRRIDNVEALLRSLARFAERKKGLDGLADHLRRLSLDSSDDGKQEAGDKVVLTTLHGAKGLEFPVVFLIGMEEEILPHARTLMPQATDVNDPDHAADISEERRLAYVGITRAQRRLYLTRSRLRAARGKKHERTPSRFLLEIPEELLDPLDLASERHAVVEKDELMSFFKSFTAD